MADLLALLSQSASSLSAHTGASATASHNLQNANTPGYSRQRAELAASTPADLIGGAYLGRGVVISAVTQARDQFIESQMPAVFGQASAAAAESSALLALTALNPDGAGTLTEALAGFFSSLRALAQNPGDPSLRRSTLAASRKLTLSFNSTAQGIESSRTGLDARVAANATQVTTLAATMADLNQKIRFARSSGGEPNDLLDARQRTLDQLTQLTGATVVLSREGDVGLALAGGLALVSGDRSASLSTLPDVTNGGHLALQLTRADGSGPVQLQNLIGGELGGQLTARDGALRTAANQVDALAFDLASAVNAKHQAGFDLSGAPGQLFFDLGGALAPGGVATKLAVAAPLMADPSSLAAASDPTGVPGDATNLLEIIATESQTLSSGLNASRALQALISDFGTSAESAKATSEHTGAMLLQLTNMRDSVSGVSIDEEMMNLSRAQRAYEAISKVISTANEMLDVLMRMT